MTTPTPDAHSLPPQYVPADVEPTIADRWQQANAFHAEPPKPGTEKRSGEAPDASPHGHPYAIVIPPPNVTAALHLGHALNNTLQDVLTRAHRMKGFNTVWLPGTDHAGIATQTVVDKRLQAEGQKALKDYKLDEADGKPGRENFIEKVTAWKDEYEAKITEQLKSMGCSCDWDRQAFTMDEPRAKAVREAFFQLFKDGLIYRGKRLVNWDPATQTALADDEVEMQDVDGHFYYMKYPIMKPADGASPSAGSPTPTAWTETGEFATVATTRPETMLGDTAVAVNPDDKPRAQFIGQFVKLPIVNRIIPIIADDYVVIPDEDSDDSKAKMASGFLKVTPAHDPNDYDIGQRHDLPIINIMAPDASISKDHGWPPEEWDTPKPTDDAASSVGSPHPHPVDEFAHTLLGLSREDARRAIIRWFKENDLLADQKPHRHAVGHSYRSHVPVEPYYSDQWYLKVTDDKLKGAALRAMDESQRTPSDDPAFTSEISNQKSEIQTGLTFTPPRYAKTFQNWHENIRDWCISRQLWWGHRIPVWSCRLPQKAERALTSYVRNALGEAITKDEAEESTFDTPSFGIVADEVEKELEGCDKEIFLIWRSTLEGNLENAATNPGNQLIEYDTNALFSDDHKEDPGEDGLVTGAYLNPTVSIALLEDDTALVSRLESAGFTQDPDVLDTWFSSALWPMSTLGWPEKTPDLDFWNTTSVLCTAREIITLWVSRMVMFNLYFLDRLPFNDVFIHAMIQDGHGQKMSKSLGNGVDPNDIIHSHGSDAMRYTLTAMTTQTQDVRLPVDCIDPHTSETFTPKFITGPGGYKVAAPTQKHNDKEMVSSFGLASGKATPTDEMPLARNTSEKFDVGQRFATKLWNATRFALPHLSLKPTHDSAWAPSLADRWILTRTLRAIEAADAALENYDFHNYANGLYQFVWNEVCDWYIESIKPVMDKDTPEGHVARQTLAAVLDVSLRLLHPMMPFVTERLWEALNEARPGDRGLAHLSLRASDLLTLAKWPETNGSSLDIEAEKDFGLIQDIVKAIREVRSQYKVPPSQTIGVSSKVPAAILNQLKDHRHLSETLANYQGRETGPEIDKPANAAVTMVNDITLYLHDIVDAEEEKKRLTKRLDELQGKVTNFEKRLSNEKYVNSAPAHLVQETRDQHAAAVREADQVREQLEAL